jgi:prevent-host-death family protein
VSTTINIHEAKTHLSRIVDEVAAGAEVIIAKAGKPMARLTPIAGVKKPKKLGQLKGKIKVLAAIEPAGFSLLPITGEHAAKVALLPPSHKDPFDRLLVAQASVEPMLLLTNDEALRGYGSFITLT